MKLAAGWLGLTLRRGELWLPAPAPGSVAVFHREQAQAVLRAGLGCRPLGECPCHEKTVMLAFVFTRSDPINLEHLPNSFSLGGGAPQSWFL